MGRFDAAGEVEVYPERSELSLSMILKWYGGDFGSKRDILGFLSQYLPPGTPLFVIISARANCKGGA